MRALRVPGLCAALALAALITLAGCDLGDDSGAGGAGSGAQIDPNDGPLSNTMINSSSPGLEPPDTMGAQGGATGAGAAEPGVSGGSAGMSTTPGAADMGGGTSGSGSNAFGSSDAGVEDAGAADAADLQQACASATQCDALAPCTDGGLHCIALQGCAHPICIDPDEACQLACGMAQCAVAESYPEQLICP